jgi:hypothetical protein
MVRHCTNGLMPMAYLYLNGLYQSNVWIRGGVSLQPTDHAVASTHSKYDDQRSTMFRFAMRLGNEVAIRIRQTQTDKFSLRIPLEKHLSRGPSEHTQIV